MALPIRRLADPMLKFPKPAFRAKRLVDFETGKSALRGEHGAWLDEASGAIPATRNFHIYLFGYASKLAFHKQAQTASDRANTQLSYDRANQVARRMVVANVRVTNFIDRFEAHGNKDYVAPAGDDSAMWRAVEVHVFLDVPPPPPPDVEPPPPCHGGVRYRRWSIAVPGGFSGSILGGMLAGNVVALRRDEGVPITHYFIAPAMGAGFSYSGPPLAKIWGWIQVLLGAGSFSGLSWTSFMATTPFNFTDLSGATCMIKSVGGGLGPGYQKATASVYGAIWFRETNGDCMFRTRDFFINVDTGGKDMQFGAGGSVVGGPLIRAR